MDNEKTSIEKSFEDLEKIIDELEGGTLSLEDSLKRFEEGVALVKTANGVLSETEEKLRILTEEEENDGDEEGTAASDGTR